MKFPTSVIAYALSFGVALDKDRRVRDCCNIETRYDNKKLKDNSARPMYFTFIVFVCLFF